MRGELAAYQAALDAERKRVSGIRKRPKKANKASRPTTVIDTPKAPTLPLVVAESPEAYGSKTMKIRNFILAHPGISHREVIRFASENFRANANFGYTTLFKMRRRGEIEVRDGNVYPSDTLLRKTAGVAS